MAAFGVGVTKALEDGPLGIERMRFLRHERAEIRLEVLAPDDPRNSGLVALRRGKLAAVVCGAPNRGRVPVEIQSADRGVCVMHIRCTVYRLAICAVCVMRAAFLLAQPPKDSLVIRLFES